MADTRDLKSLGEIRTGSSPVLGTKKFHYVPVPILSNPMLFLPTRKIITVNGFEVTAEYGELNNRYYYWSKTHVWLEVEKQK